MTVLRVNADGTETPVDLKPWKPKALPKGLSPRVVPKYVDVLLREGVKVPQRFVPYTKANMERVEVRERVAICRGLPRPVRRCEWEVIAIETHGSAKARALVAELKAADPALGVAIVLLDSGDRAVRLIAENGDVIPR